MKDRNTFVVLTLIGARQEKGTSGEKDNTDYLCELHYCHARQDAQTQEVPIASTATRGRVWDRVQWLERRVEEGGMRNRGRVGGGMGRSGGAENGGVRDSEAQRINLPMRLAQVGPGPRRRV